MEPGAAQLWLSAVGLVIAIAVPAILHLLDRKERKTERLNRARTNALAFRTDLALIESVLKRAAKWQDSVVAPLDGSPARSMTFHDHLQEAIEVFPEREQFLPYVSELGEATEPVQRLFDLLERIRAIAALLPYGLALDEDVASMRAKLEKAGELAASARLALNKLFS